MLSTSAAASMGFQHANWERSKEDTLQLIWPVTCSLGLASKGTALTYEGGWDVDKHFPQRMGIGADFLHLFFSSSYTSGENVSSSSSYFNITTDCFKQRQFLLSKYLSLQSLLGVFLLDSHNKKERNWLFFPFLSFLSKLYTPLQL